jgi:predicted DsbA family dithiol-disulfide isomerase
LAACGASQAPAAAVGSAPGDDASRVEAVPGVDLGEMTDDERATWVELVNTLLSPCGEPISVGRCAQRAERCRSCRVAARHLRRAVMDGYDRDTIDEAYEARFGPSGVAAFGLDGVPTRGPATAEVTIVVFSDFQCPHCAKAHPALVRVLGAHEGKVRLAFKHFPLLGHARALPAARAAEAARLQDRFWEMHDALFEHQDALEDADLERYAAAVGLDLARFRADVASRGVQARIDADLREGAGLGVGGTPTLFVNGRRFGEALHSLDAYVDEEVERDDHR